ncbi:hypothetical protein COO60DRAFT_1494442 [Scenedesmus sp. NREL 46B-D3]|nr:hypothetical protein COO60DRAFT_1494442 [Scenedesmus sp. NREL 46B-D3]
MHPGQSCFAALLLTHLSNSVLHVHSSSGRCMLCASCSSNMLGGAAACPFTWRRSCRTWKALLLAWQCDNSVGQVIGCGLQVALHWDWATTQHLAVLSWCIHGTPFSFGGLLERLMHACEARACC